MKIDNSNVNGGISLGLNGTNGIAGTSQSNAASRARNAYNAGEDGTSLSGFSSLVALTMSGGGDRVAELRQLVQSGQYQIDTQATSRAIVGSMFGGE